LALLALIAGSTAPVPSSVPVSAAQAGWQWRAKADIWQSEAGQAARIGPIGGRERGNGWMQDMQYVILGIAGAVFVLWTDIRLGVIEKFVASKEPDFGPPINTLNWIFVGILVLCFVAVILVPH
jgi:hypothetical protein